MDFGSCFSRYLQIVHRQKWLKTQYKRKMDAYQNTLDYGIKHGGYDADQFDYNYYNVAVRLADVEEIKRLLLERLHAEYMEYFTELENEKRNLIACFQSVSYLHDNNPLDEDNSEINLCLGSLFICVMICLLWYVLYIYLCILLYYIFFLIFV